MVWIVGFFFFFFATTVYLAVRLQQARRELDRVRRRMGRLDEIADDVASRETVETFRETTLRGDEEESPRPINGANVGRATRDSGEFAPIMQFDSDAASDDVDIVLQGSDLVLEDDDDDFAAPRMASAERSGQTADRRAHETPVGSPRTMMPHQHDLLVSVGSISVRSQSHEPRESHDGA